MASPVPAPGPDTFPLSHGQRSLWFMRQTMPESAAYNIAFAVRLLGRISIPHLQTALAILLQRHASLRTVFSLSPSGELQQHVQPDPPLAFDAIDIPAWSDDDVMARVTAAYRRPFDLEQGPLFRAHLFTDRGDRHVLLLTIHHVVFDGQSMFACITELQEIYAALHQGAAPELRPIKHSYREFVEWQAAMLASPEGAQHLAFWRERLHGAPHILDLPADHPRPAQFTGRGRSIVVELPPAIVPGLRALARAEGVHFYEILLAAYQVLLHRYSGQADILLGFLTSGRSQLKFAKLAGFFINPVVVRSLLAANIPFTRFLHRQHTVVTESLEHQSYPFLSVVENTRVNRMPGCMPLVQVLFNFFKTPRSAQFEELFVTGQEGEPVTSPGLTMQSFGLPQDEGEFDLVLECAEGRRNWLRFKYSAELFDHSTIERLAAHYLNLLTAIAADAGQPVFDLPLLGPAERRALLEAPNQTHRDYPLDTPVHQLFEAQAARTPGRLAIAFEDQTLTYAELNRRANVLAHALRARGVGPEVLVGVSLERSPEMVVALLAIHKAGGAYVPLDPHFPAARLAMIVEDAQPRVVLDAATFAELTSTPGPSDNPPPTACGENLAYVLYTSGSTGKPKGVQIPHRAFTNFQLGMQERPGIAADDVLLAVTTISFDIAGLELFLPLTAGAQIVIAPRDMTVDGRRLMQAIQRHRVTYLQATPATWKLLLDAGWSGTPGLKALCGGEALPRELANQLLPRVAELWNMYGPTETTVWSTVHRVEPGQHAIPLGTAIANTTLYILDACLNPVPTGVSGELHIGGSGVARGYLNRPELTESKFLADPFGPPGALLYKTGDLCQFRPDGSIAFLGRLDDQVKIRGHRIELGDIESSLLRHPLVREAVAIVNDEGGAKRLVAYLTAHAAQPQAAPGDLRDHLALDLPEYMIPAFFLYVEALPLTPNNKIDRKSLRGLPLPKLDSGGAYVAPTTPTQIALAALWAEILRVPRVGLQDRFDDLGGDSLTFAMMILRAGRFFGVELPVRMDGELMGLPGLAAAIDQARHAGATAPAHPTPPVFPPTLASRLLIAISRALVRLLARVDVEGRQHAAAPGPFILAGNHVSAFDFPIFSTLLGNARGGLRLRPHFVIADNWRRCAHPFAVQLGNPIYIRRGQADLDALSGALAILQAGGAVAIMPEGRVSRQGLRRAKPGIAWLASESAAPVLPLAIYGHERAFRYWARLRRVPVHVRVGPLHQPPSGGLQDQADSVMRAIARLMPPEYHGVYGEER